MWGKRYTHPGGPAGAGISGKGGDSLGSKLTGICDQITSDSQSWGASLHATPLLEKADAKEALLISPAWKRVMSSERNSKRAHLLVSPKLERAESQERCLGANLLACLHSTGFLLSEPWRKAVELCLRAEKAGKCHWELNGDISYGIGERFVSFIHANVRKEVPSVISYAFSIAEVYVCLWTGC